MIISDEMLVRLRSSVKERMSQKRFAHTLGVERAAIRLGEYFLPERINELCAAALLHDIAKELPYEEQLKAFLSYSDRDSYSGVDAALHSFAAPAIVLESYPEFATDDILDAVYNHTLGKPDMSVFCEIIFLSDYIEDGRTYESCRKVAEQLYSDLERVSLNSERMSALHRAVVRSIDFTIDSLVKRGSTIDDSVILTKNAYLDLI